MKYKHNLNLINNDLIIKGGFIDYYDFKDIEDKDDVEYYLYYPFYGIYAPKINTGLIVFDKEFSGYINKNNMHDDNYSFILIDKKKKTDIIEFSLEINVIPKNDSKTLLIENKYTQSSFNLNNKISESQEYFIDKGTVENDKFYLELSSNYKNTYIEFNNKTNNY